MSTENQHEIKLVRVNYFNSTVSFLYSGPGALHAVNIGTGAGSLATLELLARGIAKDYFYPQFRDCQKASTMLAVEVFDSTCAICGQPCNKTGAGRVKISICSDGQCR